MPVTFFQPQSELHEENVKFLFSIFNFCFMKFVATVAWKKLAFSSFLEEEKCRVNYGTFSG